MWPNDPDAQTVLIVGDDPIEIDRIVSICGDRDVRVAEGAEAAQAMLAEHPADLVIADYAGGAGVGLLRELRSAEPTTHCILVASYAEFPAALRKHADTFAERILAKPVKSGASKVIHEILRNVSRPRTEFPPAASDWPRAIALLRWTAEQLAHVEGVVIRQPPQAPTDLQLQFVLRADPSFAQFRDQLLTGWKWPVKPSEVPLAAHHRKHPVVRMLGQVMPNQEVFAKSIGGDGHVYLALLPWQREAKVTAVLGIHTDQDPARFAEEVADLHRRTVEGVIEFPLPAGRGVETESPVRYSPEYDWVVTNHYVGPDRRTRPTSFWNRYVLLGRRRRLPVNYTPSEGAFVDRLRPHVAWAVIAYTLLSGIDTWFTVEQVTSGRIGELNPVWRWLLSVHPHAFIVAKNLVALSAIFLVTRFQLWRPGMYLLLATLGGYVAVDVYWAYLVLR